MTFYGYGNLTCDFLHFPLGSKKIHSTPDIPQFYQSHSNPPRPLPPQNLPSCKCKAQTGKKEDETKERDEEVVSYSREYYRREGNTERTSFKFGI